MFLSNNVINNDSFLCILLYTNYTLEYEILIVVKDEVETFILGQGMSLQVSVSSDIPVHSAPP